MSKKMKILICLMFCIMCCSCERKINREQAVDIVLNHKKDKYPQALEFFKAEYRKNKVADSALYLGGIYEAQKSYKNALFYYNEAIKKNNIEAVNSLGAMYQHGMGVKKNIKQAMTLYREAADKGNANAAFNLANIYFFGKGNITKNYLLAKKYYEYGFSRGDMLSGLGLGSMYLSGSGVKKDKEKAFSYIRKVAEKSDIGKTVLGQLYLEGEAIPQNYSKALKLLTVASRSDDDAMYELGRMYEKGLGVPRNYKKALELYQKASEYNNIEACYRLGGLYLEGKGTAENIKKAELFFSRAAMKNNHKAQVCLGLIYLNGDLGRRDYDKAFKFFTLAIDGNNLAAYKRGTMFEYGKGVPVNYQQAFKDYKKSAEGGYAEALYKLGKFYYLGRVVDGDIKKAEEYFEQALKKTKVNIKRRKKIENSISSLKRKYCP